MIRNSWASCCSPAVKPIGTRFALHCCTEALSDVVKAGPLAWSSSQQLQHPPFALVGHVREWCRWSRALRIAGVWRRHWRTLFMKHRLSPAFRRGHATLSGTLRGGAAIAPGGSAFPGVLGVAAALGRVAGVPGGDEDRGLGTAVGDFGGVVTGPAAGAGRTRGGRAGGVGEAGTAFGCGLVLLCAPGWAGSAMYCCQLPNRSLRIARHQLALIRAFLSTAGRCFSASAFALRSGLASGARTWKSFGTNSTRY